MSSTGSPITYTIDEGVAEVVMDRPPVNALRAQDWQGLADMLLALGKNPEVRVVVLRAEGRGYNAGVDIKEMQAAKGHGELIAVNHAYLDQPDMSDVLPTITVPCLVFAGDADERHSGAEECAKHIPDARWVSLPGLDHGQANQRIDMALPHIESFLKDVTSR